MLSQNNVLKEPVVFPVLGRQFDSIIESDSDTDTEETQDIVAISFKHAPSNQDDNAEDEEEKKEDNDTADINVEDIEKILTRLFDQDETDLNIILNKATSFTNPHVNEKIESHLQSLKSLSDYLYNKTFDYVDERTYLCYMTTTTDKLTEIDGVILRHYYLEKFAWKSDLLSSIRILCLRLFFKGESQNIDIMIHSFANNWFSRYNRPSFIYGNIIGVYLVTYALILLNTDLHNDHTITTMRSNSQHSLSTSSIQMSRRKSGSLFDIFSHDTSSSYVENGSSEGGRRLSIPNITKNQFVMNTIAALNDNFVIVNPMIMRKQLRMYYSNVKTHEILLPKFIDDRENEHEKEETTEREREERERIRIKMIAPKREDIKEEEEEDPNDEVTDLRSFLSLRMINSSYSVASTKYSFELVSGTVKETIGAFGFLREIQRYDSRTGILEDENENSDANTNNNLHIDDPLYINEKYLAAPIVKEGLQKVLVNDLFKVTDEDNYERYNSSAFLFKDIPENPKVKKTTIKKRKSSIFKRFGKNKEEEEEEETTNRVNDSTKFKFAECFVAICDGELRLFEFDKNPDKVNSFNGHGRGEWTDWAKCLASVSLTGCYAEIIGDSKRKASQDEKSEIDNIFGEGIYWKLELPYSMMEMVNEDCNDGNCDGFGSKRKRENQLNALHVEKFEKIIFSSFTIETAIEFVNTCNYWSGMRSKVPTIGSQFLDDMNLTSFEYGFSDNIVNMIVKISQQLQDEKDDKKAFIIDGLQSAFRNEKRITEWKPIVHSCQVVDEDITCGDQLREMDRYLEELSEVIIQQRYFLQECRKVYNEAVLTAPAHRNSRQRRDPTMSKALLTVYSNHRSACLSLLRERRRWRVQRGVVSRWQGQGQRQRQRL